MRIITKQASDFWEKRSMDDADEGWKPKKKKKKKKKKNLLLER